MHEQKSKSALTESSANEDRSSQSVPGNEATPYHAEPDHVSTSLNHFGRQLGAMHRDVRVMRTDALLLDQLSRYEVEIQDTYRYFKSAVEEQEVLSYAAEWLLDNYFVVRQAIRAVEHDMPPAYYDRLPKLTAPGADHGAPRIYVVARAFVDKQGCVIQPQRLARFLSAYQVETPLTMGELWALPIMLRLLMFFTLAEAASRVAHLAQDLPRAAVLRIEYELDDDEQVAKAITGLRAIDSQDWNEFFERVSLVEQILRKDPASVYPGMDFATRDQYRKVVEQLAEGTTHSEREVAEKAIWLAQRGQEPEQAGHGSAKEGSSLHEQRPESQESAPHPVQAHEQTASATTRSTHVGIYLYGDGLRWFKSNLGYKSTSVDGAIDWILAHPTQTYLGSIAAITGLFMALVVWYAIAANGSVWVAILAVALAIVPACTAAVSFTNWVMTRILPTRQLPRMDYDDTIPQTASTMVVVPALISLQKDVTSLFEQLELHYLRNVDPERNIRFALLTDFTDASEECLEQDQFLIEATEQKLHELNRKYPGAPFYFFHRKRLWNPSDQVWMGWERKRGKLHEFNHLLRCTYDPERRQLEDNTTSYRVVLGDLSFLSTVRYVITLDADTVLPTGAGRRLIGVMHHPLNRAQFDAETGRVSRGYTVLQPRTEIIATSANRSLFTRIFAGEPGVDLYTFAVSDVYQDLFGEGIYVGKGIYDVDAFERSVQDRIPDNTLLSHDLFEGIQGRAGLVTDVVLYEEYPPNYLVKVHRGHRWVRGDWQLLPWLFNRVPAIGGYISNDLSLIARWKIFDNLRRSLVAPALLLFLFAAWIVLPGSPYLWTLFGLACLGVSVVTAVLHSLIRYASTMQPDSGTVTLAKLQRWPIVRSVVLFVLELAFVPYEALRNMHAIVLTLVRLYVTRRNLLEWVTAARSAQLLGANVSAETTFRHMLPAILLVMAGGTATVMLRPDAIPAALPIWLLWVFAAEIAHMIGRPVAEEAIVLTPGEQRELRILARKTWLFFEHFVGPEDNWLPPDHYQEFPRGVVAHRTSPTNIGLYLISVLTAHRFGYENLQNASLRLHAAFDSIDRLELYRGHLYNWFRTTDLGLLHPAYISYVDSGNLAACLVVLRQGCNQIGDVPVLELISWRGLLDTLDLVEQTIVAKLAEAAREHRDSRSQPNAFDPVVEKVRNQLEEFRSQIDAVEHQPLQWSPCLASFAPTKIGNIEAILVETVTGEESNLSSDAIEELSHLLGTLRHQVSGMLTELRQLAPGLTALAQVPDVLAREGQHHELVSAWQQLSGAILHKTRLRDVPTAYDDVLQKLTILRDVLVSLPATEHSAADAEQEQAIDWCDDLATAIQKSQKHADRLWSDVKVLALRAERLLSGMDFSFLFDKQRKQFHIGFNADTGRLDPNYYDLLVSEARIGSLYAIADNQVPMKHWLFLSRPLSEHDNQPLLLSWSGTMFEYLMPMLLMRSYPGTLLHESCRRAVERQIEYARERVVPWGISESGYHHFDAAMNYQYRAFGTPGLGLKRGLEDDLVITPYASFLALPMVPREVLRNLQALRSYQVDGRYGMYEALDFTEVKDPVTGSDGRGKASQERPKPALVQSYMAHHQAMIFASLANVCLDDYLIELFHAEPKIQSVELLLQEQIPAELPAEALVDTESLANAESVSVIPEASQSWSAPVDTPMPIIHALSNSHLTTIVSSAGAGYTTWKGQRITRWRPDTTLDNWGHWLYVSDLSSGATWSAGRQPLGVTPMNEETVFSAHAADFRRRDGEVRTELKVVVTPVDDVEVRCVTISNDGDSTRRLRLTSYAEVVLADAGSDNRHPAFAKLFVESEYVAEKRALFFRSRPRSDDEATAILAHSLVIPNGTRAERISYESDRAAFIGRYGTTRSPSAMQSGFNLSKSTGATLDPIMSLQADIVVAPHSTVELAFVTSVSTDRQHALDIVEKYQAWTAIERAFPSAVRYAGQQLQEAGLSGSELHDAEKLLSLLLYPNSYRRAGPETLASNANGQQALWPQGISGDYPILLLHISDTSNLVLLRQIIAAYKYWRRQGITIELVIVNEEDSSYTPEVQGFLQRLLSSTGADKWLHRRGGVFVVRKDQIAPHEYVTLETAARVVLHASDGAIDEQLQGMEVLPAVLPDLITTLSPADIKTKTPPVVRPKDLMFDNGLGGFSRDGKEYVIYLEPGTSTPAPWINVIANEEFGFLASENGGGYTWAVNSGENRLTTWRNDPVTDMPAEAIYMRDEETGEVWSPTRSPAPAPSPYLICHGAGYTIHEHNSHGLMQQVRLFTPMDDPQAPERTKDGTPVKIMTVRVKNVHSRIRRLSITLYTEWILGALGEPEREFIVPEYHNVEVPVLLAHNPYSPDFPERYMVLSAGRAFHGLTTDRTEFLGRHGSLEYPAALRRVGLSNTVRAGLDTCGTIQVHVDLPIGGEEEIHFVVGQGVDRSDALALARRFQHAREVENAWQKLHDHWDTILGTIQVTTPDDGMNLLLNRWLLYQALACRIWGRSAHYQSSGAYGFRDQLQDVLSLLHAQPDIARRHIIRSANHQFDAGDVLHWWHPPAARGVRTRISDDLLWLPYVTTRYIEATGDTDVLDEEATFLVGEPLRPEEHERYAQYAAGNESFSVFEHCRRALEKGSNLGRHSLPLMGGGDWNDGMNRVGIDGEGESIWLGWFRYRTLMDFAQLCERTGRSDSAGQYRTQAQKLAEALEAHGWDGDWYLRAYFDDGSPLGSSSNRECRIDSIVQSWAVLSNGGDQQRARQGMNAVLDNLVRWEDKLILLFEPPFNDTRRDPGYIKGYLPGIRENGGQYTHAALWTIWAFVELHEGNLANSLFRLINPVYRATNEVEVERYKAEPYVISADVYGVEPHVGRGGWTWYTGSSGWMYRLGIEGILGISRKGTRLVIDPCIPKEWTEFCIAYTYGKSHYHIEVQNMMGVSRGVKAVLLDGEPQPDKSIELADDGKEHSVEVQLGE